MNSEKTDFNKIELIRKLEILRELEMKKPINEIDTDFIDEIVLFGLELKGLKATLTPEEVEEKVRKIPFVEKTTTLNTPPTSVKGRATKVKSHKILLIAAIISILVAIFTISSIAFDWNIFDELKNRFGTVAEAPVNEAVDVNGVSVYMYGKDVKYNNFEEFLENENIEILYPLNLLEDISLTEISVYKENGKIKLDYIYDDSDFMFSVIIDKKITINAKAVANEILIIDDLECFVIEMQDIGVVQIYFEYNNNLYKLNYNNKQALIEIIENLKESE